MTARHENAITVLVEADRANLGFWIQVFYADVSKIVREKYAGPFKLSLAEFLRNFRLVLLDGFFLFFIYF